MTWRYQPVWIGDGEGRTITLCECYFEEDLTLRAWTKSPSMHPQGDTVEELLSDLAYMIECTHKWPPVVFADLQVGMLLARAGEPS